MTLARKRDWDKFEKALEQAKKDVIKKVTEKAGHDMEFKFLEVISAFYDDYDPTVYERWGGLDDAGQTTYDIDGYPESDAEVKLNLSGSNILEEFGKDIYNPPGRKNPISADHIFSDAFEYGYHGHAELLQTFDWMGGDPQEAIPPMSPPPKEIFDDWFEDYKKNIKTELGDFIADECEKAIRRNLR
jgi:hypothetical protein